jgi:hypothetical protein
MMIPDKRYPQGFRILTPGVKRAGFAKDEERWKNGQEAGTKGRI